MAAGPSTPPQNIEELIRAVESSHEQYIRSLRSLHDGLGAGGHGIANANSNANAQAGSSTGVHAAARRERDRADSRSSTLPLAMTPPLRAFTTFSNPPTSFGSESGLHLTTSSGNGNGNGTTIQFSQPSSLPRLRRSTLEATAERPASLCPSPRPLLPLTPVPNADPRQHHHDFSIIPDEDITWIPLLDATSSSASAGGRPVPPAPSSIVTNEPDVILVPRGHQRHRLTPMTFSDDMLMRHLRDPCLVGDGSGSSGSGDDLAEAPLAKILEEATRRRGEMSNPAMSFREFAAYERESYVNPTFEVYDVMEDSSAVRVSVDMDAAGGAGSTMGARYGGDGVPYETSDGIVDASTVWEAIKDVNLDGDAVGRITYVCAVPAVCARPHRELVTDIR